MLYNVVLHPVYKKDMDLIGVGGQGVRTLAKMYCEGPQRIRLSYKYEEKFRFSVKNTFRLAN